MSSSRAFRSRALAVLALAAFVGSYPDPLPAQAVSCGNSRISYVQTGNGPDVTELCSSGFFTAVCQEPILSGPTYSFDPGCSPFFGTCSGSVSFDVEFPGNHNNGFDQFFSYATVELRRLNGTLIGDCGHPFATITQDFGTVTVTGSANCTHPGVSIADLVAFTCREKGSCHKQAPTVRLDFDVAGGCVPPLMQECNGDASCMDCTAGGVGPGGGGPGLGGPGSPRTGPKATLRYAAGGAGHPGLPGSADWIVALGLYWSHDYAERIIPLPDESKVWLITKHGTYREWASLDGSTGVYQAVAPSSEKRTLTWLGAGAGWKLTGLDGAVHLFDDAGRWLSATGRNGTAKTATYGAGGELQSVSFPDGRREDFAYHPSGKLASITEIGIDGVTSSIWSYTWSDGGAGDELARIDRPDTTALLYTYGDARYPGYLTRVELEGTDGTSVRVLRAYEYDDKANVTKTWAGDPSPTGNDAVDVWRFAFDDPAKPTVTTVTPPIGDGVTYTLERDTVSENTKVVQVSGDCPVCNVGPNAQLEYTDADNPLLPTRITDARGTVTAITYDAFGQRTSRTEADGEAGLQRTTFWTYDATYPALLTSMEEPSVAGGAATRTTDWIRDASGNATSRTISGSEAGSGFSYTTTMTYNVAGQVLSVDSPGHGTADETTFIYDPARGSLVADSRTDPLVGTTTFGHDVFNRRTSVTDPNGVETTTAYDELDRVTEIRQVGASPPTDDLVTTHEHTDFGDLLRTTRPEGNVLEYGYDAAGRLISVERKPDAATPGERVFYTLDEAGNRTREELQRWDAAASAWVTFSSTEYDYTNRCRLDRIVQSPDTPEQAVTEFSYDCNGNLVEQWDPNHDSGSDPPTTSYTYDALDRLTEVSRPWNPAGGGGGSATTSYAYDLLDHLTAVTDAEGNVTTYEHSDRDLLTQEVSPVSGTTTHGYDEHGELVTTTDARGITVTRTVDELDRVSFVDYPDDALDTTYTYDSQPAVCAGSSFPVGRLAAITRGGQAVEYCFDRFGRTTRDGELTYTWDGNGNRTGIGYPGGVVAAYTHDFADREVALEVTTPGGVEPVVQAASYLPSGPLSTLELGSGTTETRAFDGRYAPTAIALTGSVEKTFSYTTDRVGNVLEIVEQGGCTPGPLVLENQTVTTKETFTSCTTIEAGDGYSIESPGDVTFNAQGTIVLKDGFSVGSGASFTAGSGEIPPQSVRTYTYQAPQYFLTSADGPWGELDWTYDRIGNRLSESRGGGTPDSYQYLTNGSGGNTPVLDVVNLGVGGTRDYTYGLAGHLEEVAAGGNLIDFAADAEGRLSGTTRTAADVSATVSYDGRTFLTRAVEMTGDPPAEAASVEAVYDSDGLVHALRRQASPTDPQELVVFVYLAGRPVAQLAIDGAGAETWTYLTTDHLGTPLLATDDAGAVTWEGGLEPFGRDYQAGTSAGALENGIYLRLPGQWDESTWTNATSGAGIIYNLARWLETGTGRYTRPDPLAPVNTAASFAGPSPFEAGIEPIYGYARMNPLLLIDPLGLKSRVCCRKIPWVPASHCFIQIEREGKKTTCGLHGGRFSSGEEAGVGQIRGPNTFDDEDQSDCGPWNEECGTDECVIKTAGDYANPSVYGAVTKSNSNSFAGHVARECGLARPDNIAKPRGWNRAPASAKPGREKIGSPCKLPGGN